MWDKFFSSLVLSTLIIFFFLSGCGNGKEEEPFDPYVLYSATHWEVIVRDIVDGQTIKLDIIYGFRGDGSYYYKRWGYSGGFSTENELESYRIDEAGSYVATETEITFTPESGIPYTVTWSYNEAAGSILITYSDGTSIELFLFMLADLSREPQGVRS